VAPVAVVTGAAGGIGRATVQAFQQEGWYVVGIDRTGPEDSKADLCLQADVAEPTDVDGAFAEVARSGHVAALVNNAALQITGTLVDTTPDEWDTVMASNVRSAFLTIGAVYPLMREHGGAIVNVSSVHAVATSPGISAYATSKGALVALTRAAAIELAPEAIRVNAVLPGAVDTPMLHAGLERAAGTLQERIASLAARTPLGRIGSPNEIAQAILYLADPRRSSFVTGQTLIVDGGATVKLGTED